MYGTLLRALGLILVENPMTQAIQKLVKDGSVEPATPANVTQAG
jgi:hypothetical protein